MEDIPRYEKKPYKSIGLVAAIPAPLVPWHTAYCLNDSFGESDSYDIPPVAMTTI